MHYLREFTIKCDYIYNEENLNKIPFTFRAYKWHIVSTNEFLLCHLRCLKNDLFSKSKASSIKFRLMTIFFAFVLCPTQSRVFFKSLWQRVVSGNDTWLTERSRGNPKRRRRAKQDGCAFTKTSGIDLSDISLLGRQKLPVYNLVNILCEDFVISLLSLFYYGSTGKE